MRFLLLLICTTGLLACQPSPDGSSSANADQNRHKGSKKVVRQLGKPLPQNLSGNEER